MQSCFGMCEWDELHVYYVFVHEMLYPRYIHCI